MVRLYILLLVLSLYISITLLEGLLILGLIYIVWKAIREKSVRWGKLGIPILLYALPTLLSTLIYYTERFNKAIEEGFFQFAYLINVSREEISKLLRDISLIFTFGFFFLIPFELYSFSKYGEPKPVWGGTFETGFFYTLSGLTFLILSFRVEGFLKFFYYLCFLISFLIVILSHRRSMILAFVMLFLLVLFILYRNKIVKRTTFLTFIILFIGFGIGGYVYLSKTDIRFKTLNSVILGKEKLDETTINRISSGRYTLFKEGLHVLEKDISQGKLLPLIIGHGVRAKEYLTPNSPIHQPRYESFFLFSEFIERGLVGVIGIILIYVIYLRELLFFRIEGEEDLYRLVLLIPLGIHLLQTLFTYFWDAMLPVFLILFKIYELSKEQKS